MKSAPTALPEVGLLEPQVFADSRGFFFESFNVQTFRQVLGPEAEHFVQDNQSFSQRGVLRGLHYQIRQAQGKLVRVIAGEIFDVAVDLRRTSPRFGRWVGVSLSAENKRQLWIPKGFGHGFLVTSAAAEVLYKTTDYWAPEHERTIRWNDPTLAIEWPECTPLTISKKDAEGAAFAHAEVFE